MERSIAIQKSCLKTAQEGFDQLNGLWREMGYDDADILARNEKVSFYMNELVGQMIKEQEGEKTSLLLEIEGLLENADKLGKELKVNISVDVDDKLPLLRVKACLEDRLQQYLVCRAERVAKLAGFMKQASELSVAMGKVDIPHLPEVPSEQELEDLKNMIRNYTDIKVQRIQTFKDLRSQIVSAMDRMEHKPELDFERRVIEGKSFVLSEQNMGALRELGQKMERRLADTEELVAELREKLSVLWDRLNESTSLREQFLLGFAGIGKDTIAALRTEINRCEEKKRANIKQFVLAVREELQKYWNQCYFSAAQRDEFRHFKSDLFVEDLLDFHEQELERVKQFYKENQRLYELIEERQEIWARKSVLECRSKSPSRLYDNRGGKLLLEEKERKMINRKLPKIEKELQTLANQFEEEKGEPFFIDGKPLTEFLLSQWEQHEAGKEMQKRERKERNQTLGEPSVTKRKLVATPSHVNAKRIRPDATSSAKVKTPASVAQAQTRPVKIDPVRQTKIARKAFESKIAVRMPTTNQNVNPNKLAATADTTTYTEFQVQLDSRVATRSSAKFHAKNQNATYRAKTPVGDRNATYRARTPVGVRTPIPYTPLNAKTPSRSPATLSVTKSRLQAPTRNRLPFLF